jgi:hypothetical protein
MFCNSCGRQNDDRANFCQGCGRPIALPSKSGLNAGLGTPPKRRIGWIPVIMFLFLGLFVIGKIASTFDASKQSPDIARPSIPPPPFRIYRQDLGFPIAVQVAKETSDEQLRSLLWLFREKVRKRRFGELGLKKPTSAKSSSGSYDFNSGMIEVFRGEKRSTRSDKA